MIFLKGVRPLKGTTPLGSVRGFTVFELMLVLLIMAIGSVLVYPSVQKGVENRKAKHALGNLRTITNAMRLYEINTGALPPNPTVLEDAGYIKLDEFAPGFDYTINTVVIPPATQATDQSTGRYITLALDPDVKGQDGTVTDSAGYLTGITD